MSALHTTFIRQHRKLVLNLLRLKRVDPGYRSIHGTIVCQRTQPEISSEPVKFTSSAANMPSKLQPRDVNKYERLIVTTSLIVFLAYFAYLREGNDLDELLFAPSEVLEETYLASMIPLLKEREIDTRQAETKLTELVEKRLAAEKLQKSKD